MKARIGVLVVLAHLSLAAWIPDGHLAVGNEQTAGDPTPEAIKERLDQRRKLLEAARAKATQTWKAAAALRIQFNIIDIDPESETNPTSAPSNSDGLKNYVVAKREYLKAKAELQKLEFAP